MSAAKHTTGAVVVEPGYEVTRDGRVFSVETNWRGRGRFELTPDLNSHGYPSVRIYVQGRRKRIAVHRLVARAFLDERPSFSHEICHLDGDRTNNRAENLRWGTRAENAADRERHGRTSRGHSHSEAIKRGLEARHVAY